MKLKLPFCVITLLIISVSVTNAQCPAGYTQAQLNWDRLDYYFNSGGTAPYSNYVTYTMERTQKFGIGPNYVTITTPANGIVDGENALHTGDITGFLGEDAQFIVASNGQAITLTFKDEVYNLEFTLYDVDYDARMDFDATNGSGTAQVINTTLQGSPILTQYLNNSTTPYVVASGSAQSNSSNRATVTVSIAGPVKQVIITNTTRGSDPVFWLSDINACVSGSFPNDYQKTGNNQPLQGPYVNQPDYFIITPDDNSAYMVNPANGEARLLFTDASNTYMNCFAFDPYNHIIYYVSEGWPAVSTNKQLKKYDFNTNTISVVIADISATFNIPTFDQSLEGAGGAFYNGQLYLGVEGGKYNVSGTSNDRTRESMIFRIDFDASLNPVDICQVFSVPSYLDASNTAIQDWGDFILKNGELINYNSRTTPTDAIKFEHFNMMTGASVQYTSSSISASQAGMDWNGNLYSFYTDGIMQYDGAGGFTSALIPITLPGGTWPGGAGDAGENFRPAVDFGDAPASYDPDPASPASHDIDPLVKLGTNYDNEWVSRGQAALANSDNYDDALPFVSTFDPEHYNYLLEATVFNNSGSDATVCAWLDFDGDGIYEAAEGITVTVGSSASAQSVFLYWPLIYSGLSHGDYTYLRVRITRASDGMTTSNSTGYFPAGEVEDYRVAVNSYALSVQSLDFDAKLTNTKTVKLNWNIADESNISYYVVERNADLNNNNWENVNATTAKNANGSVNYELLDPNTLEGISYYRIKMVYRDGSVKISQVKKVENKAGAFSMSVAPNPARLSTVLYVYSDFEYNSFATVEILNSAGSLVYKNKMKLAAGNNSLPIQTDSKMPAGQYLIRVICEKQVFTKPLIITN